MRHVAKALSIIQLLIVAVVAVVFYFTAHGPEGLVALAALSYGALASFVIALVLSLYILFAR